MSAAHQKQIMGYDVCEIDSEDGTPTVRVDTWDATGRHWLYYFRKSDSRKGYELATTTDVSYEGDRIDTEFGISSAEEKMEESGFDVKSYDK